MSSISATERRDAGAANRWLRPALAVLILAALLVANIARPGPLDWRQRLERLTGLDLKHCPACGARWIRIPLPGTPGGDTS